jgi:RNA 2',3'-cyclic 3'-phosphodiesterase
VRSFVALPIPAPARDEARERLAPLRARRADLRWVPTSRWHLTLAFLGDVPEEVVDALQPRLERVAGRYAPLRLRLEAGGRFDHRVLWLGVGGERQRLARLAASVAAAGDRVGIAREPGRYRPHLTVARARERVDLATAVAHLQDGAGPWFVADRLTLFASRVGASVEHAPVNSWLLRGRQPDEP